MIHECESCLVAGIHTPATTHSRNPDYSGYDLCAECAAEYDSRTLPARPKRLCLRCGHAWTPRSAEPPARCPECDSPYWNRPRRQPPGASQ